MATITHDDQPVSPELLREHAEGWHAFTRFIKYAIGAVAILLILMAIFLL